jgi:predicted glycosyltransferase/peptidoglycan/xylan/chitin deacetylase (PgdA/CDA1 family)
VNGRPRLLFYCQHSLGLGHLVRSYALAEELARSFDVAFLRGGENPPGIAPPPGVEIRQLPPLDGLAARRGEILDALRGHRPDVLVVELFPFGRKKFAPELMPLLEAAREADPAPLVVCSLRDILVDRGDRQVEHDERASIIANAYFDTIAVHSDPAFARLEESFRPRTTLRTPVHHTGFVVPEAPARTGEPGSPVLVSAGGGLVGERLLATAVEARPLLPEGIALRLVAGPFLPDEAFARLRAAAEATEGIELLRTVPKLESELAVASASVSQCGYNTALAVVRSGLPALVVPFEEGPENEQGRRARRLEQLGLVRVLPSERLDASTLAAELAALSDFRPRKADLRFDGAGATAALVADLAHRPRRTHPRGRAWLEPLVAALGNARAPVSFFFRNDDVGWADERLPALLDRFAAEGVPLDLAVIPAALGSALAEELVRCRDESGVRIGVHQHGYAHMNHEPDGRKCEFGPARAASDQRRDIEAGRERLRDLLGQDVDPVFTPPWNRCTAVTGACLVELGFVALSRESRAEPLDVAGLAEIPVAVDWYGRRKGTRVGRAELGQQLAAAVAAGAVVGVMLHHAELSDAEIEDTSALLRAVSSHGAARLSFMRDLAPS